MTARVRGPEPGGERHGLHQQRRLVDVDIGGHRARGADRGGRIHARVRGGDDLVLRADRERAQGKLERIGSVADRDALGRAAIRGELALERLDLGSENEPAAIADTGDRLVEEGAQRRVVPGQVVQRDHGRQPAASSAPAHTSFQSRKSGANASGNATSPCVRGLQQK